MILRQPEFVDRNNFAAWLNRTGRTGWAVEVGTHRADFASLFLPNWHGAGLFCVDPYAELPGYERQHLQLADSDGDREKDYAYARRRLAPHGARAQFLRMASVEAARTFQDGRLDFVYVDADHRYEEVVKDLAAWWPKIRPGGVLAGHDFVSHGPDSDAEGVQPAVLEFAALHGLAEVWMVTETLTYPWSWFLERPE